MATTYLKPDVDPCITLRFNTLIPLAQALHNHNMKTIAVLANFPFLTILHHGHTEQIDRSYSVWRFMVVTSIRQNITHNYRSNHIFFASGSCSSNHIITDREQLTPFHHQSTRSNGKYGSNFEFNVHRFPWHDNIVVCNHNRPSD